MRDGRLTRDGWARLVDAVLRGERPDRPLITLGPTSSLLQGLGLAPADLAMAAGKIARCRREHPEVPLATWHALPLLMRKPLAVIPSARRDGSLVVVLVVTDVTGSPVLVPVVPGADGAPNVILSVYGKEAGYEWIRRQIEQAAVDGMPCYVGKGFAAALPQPGSAKAIPSSSGPIPADGTAKPDRHILSTVRRVKGDGPPSSE